MNYLGVSSGFHDAGAALIDNHGEILFAGHSERYSKLKHDPDLSADLISDALSYSTSDIEVHYYERPWLKYLRRLRSGESPKLSSIPVKIPLLNQKIHSHSHHLSHAAASFQTSPFNDATVVIIDAIGEFETITIWHAEYIKGKAHYKKLWSKTYPDSIGLFYSAMTKRVGLRPMDEEYILMGMASYGSYSRAEELENAIIADRTGIDFTMNLHTGISDAILQGATDMDIAATTQVLTESLIYSVMERAYVNGHSNNLVYGGGVALNCRANSNLHKLFDRVWIMPNPGDAGSSLGAAALGYGGKLNWKTPYLGKDIPGPYPVNELLTELLNGNIVGVANGRAEFGPRALGNRSLLADPRGPDIKNKVNSIKRRQQFRPFAPVILEEFASAHFHLRNQLEDNRYMQYVSHCKNVSSYPAIAHIDGTSRVQTVPADGSGLRQLLEKWYVLTECPMLLNTSLNIRGEPMVNDVSDADRFTTLYGVNVYS